MVYDSWEWKRELREKKKEILRYNTKENFDHHFDSTYFKVERALLYSATIIRILIESQKLSDDIDQYKINVSKNEPIKHIDRLHRWLDEDEYNWDNTAHEKVYGKNVCNWLIHSYVFRFQLLLTPMGGSVYVHSFPCLSPSRVFAILRMPCLKID